MFDDVHLKPSAANHAPQTPLDLLDKTVQDRPGAIAVRYENESWTWAEFDAAVQRMAAGLAAHGVGRGDVVAVLAGNVPEMIVAHFAVPLLGAILNTINTRLDTDTIRYILNHSEARVVLADNSRGKLAAAVAEGRPCLVCAETPQAGEPFAVFHGLEPERRFDWREVVTDEWQPIALNYTSGTTGNPKGVVLHHRGAWQNALGNRIGLSFGPETVYLWTLPLFHCNGWCHAWAVTAAGGTHICLDGVEPMMVFDAIARHSVTDLACAPVVLYMLLDHPARQDRNQDSPRVTVGTGGAAPTTSLIAQMDILGFDLTHLYGLTECYGPCTINPLPTSMSHAPAADKARYLASQGRPHATGPALRVIDKDGADVPADGEAQGEIVLRGNTIMAGYLKNEKATKEAFEAGWFRTGDIATIAPDGRIHIRDRSKDVIISGGENISSLEIEEILHRHPAVAMAAVVAAPHPKWGETPCAFIETCGPLEVTEIDTFCREHLAGFKRPRHFVFDELPRTATGKVQKFILRLTAAKLAEEDRV